MCGNAIFVSEFAKLIVEEERLSAFEFIDKANAGELEPMEDGQGGVLSLGTGIRLVTKLMRLTP